MKVARLRDRIRRELEAATPKPENLQSSTD
jgi:hypothetical protein